MKTVCFNPKSEEFQNIVKASGLSFFQVHFLLSNYWQNKEQLGSVLPEREVLQNLIRSGYKEFKKSTMPLTVIEALNSLYPTPIQAAPVEVQKEESVMQQNNSSNQNSDLPKLFNKQDKELKKGSVVEYNGKKYLFWNNNNGKAQLINTDGTKFSGTPNIDKLTILGSYKTVLYNNIEYIVTDNDNIYSGATGNLVYTGTDNSSQVQKNSILAAAKNSVSRTNQNSKITSSSNNTINIFAGTNENADLSNFAIRPFTIELHTDRYGPKAFTFQSVEQAFQFLKTMFVNNPQVGKKILQTTNGRELRQLTSRENLPMTPEQVKEWDSNSSQVMEDLIYSSFDQNPAAVKRLVGTGNSTITHKQDTTKWKTEFPRILMKVRELFKTSYTEYTVLNFPKEKPQETNTPQDQQQKQQTVETHRSYPNTNKNKLISPDQFIENTTYDLGNGKTGIFVGYRFARVDNYEKSKVEIAVFNVNNENIFRAVNGGKNYDINIWNKSLTITRADAKLYNVIPYSDLTINPRINEESFILKSTFNTQETNKVEIIPSTYTRQSVQNDSDSMYLFTDNAQRTSRPTATVENVDKNSWYYKKYKSQTNKPIHFGSLNNPSSAVMRGLNNAYPISTMSAYGTDWTDANFDLFKTTIDDEIAQIKKDLPKFSKIKISNSRIGQGGMFASLPKQHQAYLDKKLLEIGIDNTGDKPKIVNNKTTKIYNQEISNFQNQQQTKIAFDKELAKKIQEILEKLYPELKLIITNNPIWEQGGNIFNQKEFNNQVNYILKATKILLSDRAKQIFTKGEKSNWDLNKILTELAISKEQKQLLLDLGIKDREQLALKLASKYGFNIEINTAKDEELEQYIIEEIDLQENPITGEIEKIPVFNVYQVYVNLPIKTFLEKDKAEKFVKTQKEINNSKHYSNLTVPGGTNYTENEIKTPNITPSIKGHAQFSTDKGIGWFRSDDKVSEQKKEFSDLLNKNKIEDADRLNELRKTKDLPTKIRRILEVQSDLFQKGRNKESLIQGNIDTFEEKEFKYNNGSLNITVRSKNINRQLKLEIKIGNEWKPLDSNIFKGNTEKNEFKDFVEKEINLKKVNTTSNQFLQLLNKDNNWVTFFVKSIIQDSAKKGYEKVLFPTGNTASRIEGHATLEEFKKQKEDRIKELEDFISNPTYDKIQVRSLDTQENQIEENLKSAKREINQLKQELERVEREGFAALRPIYNFYENVISNILKKQGYNPILITDEYGNTWNEISINQARDLAEILLQYNEANQIIGQANTKAMTVLVDAIKQKQDTLPHEYAHHYIAWFRDTPIVQEAIKKWGSEEALVQSIGEQVVKQKGEAYNWWNNFVKWVMNQFNSLSKLKKEELTQILTDAFLTRQDLSENTTDENKTIISSERQQQIEELFNHNLELVNEVYKTLGFNSYELTMDSFMPKKHWKIGHIIDNPTEAANICDNTQIRVLNYILDKFGKPKEKGTFYAKPVTIWAKSPINDKQIHHSTVAVRINDKVYLYDMPQSEYIEYVSENKGKVIKEYKPRLIEYTPTNLQLYYGTSNENLYIQDEVILTSDLINLNQLISQQNPQAIEIYSNYLNTIFPDSKVKDIVYHGTDTKFAKFDKSFYRSGSDYIYFGKLNTPGFKNLSITIPALINLKNPSTFIDNKTNKLTDEDGFIEDYTSKFMETAPEEGEFLNQYGVKEPEQIHILGSKQDIEGFQNYVNNKSKDSPIFVVDSSIIDTALGNVIESNGEAKKYNDNLKECM